MAHIPQGPPAGEKGKDYTGKRRGWYSLRHPRFAKFKIPATRTPKPGDGVLERPAP